PAQTIILKTTGVVCGLNGRQSGLQRRMIDEDQTRDFANYCRQLRAAERGNSSLRKQLLEHGRAADKQLERMLTDAANLPEALKEIAKNFTEAELKIIRNSLAVQNQTVLAFPPKII